MGSSVLKNLPASRFDRTGWPWTKESFQLPDRMPDGSPWPKICIVTPSYNQAKYIEETIRSVLLQGYPALQYIVIDGCSTDGSVEIIKKYSEWIDYWVSEPDRGQTHAINKGLARCQCDIFAWINSDDFYLPNALSAVACKFNMIKQNSIIAGRIIEFGSILEKETLIIQNEITLRNMVQFWDKGNLAWHQPALFFPMKRINEIGKLDETLSYLMDYDLLCRLLQTCKVDYLEDLLARFRLHEAAKTCLKQASFRKEMCRISHRYWHLVPDLDATSAYLHVINFMVTTAIHELRKANFQESFDLFRESLRMKPHLTVEAVLKEIHRLIMGGRLTGRTLS